MDQQITFATIKKLSIAERILLAEEIWDSVVAEQEQIELTDSQRDELDRRIVSNYANPDAGSTWANVKKRIKKEK